MAEFSGGFGNAVLLEVTTGADADEGGASHAPDHRVRFVMGAYADREIDPILYHVPNDVRENQIDLKARIERQQLGDQRKNVEAAESRSGSDPDCAGRAARA